MFVDRLDSVGSRLNVILSASRDLFTLLALSEYLLSSKMELFRIRICVWPEDRGAQHKASYAIDNHASRARTRLSRCAGLKVFQTFIHILCHHSIHHSIRCPIQYFIRLMQHAPISNQISYQPHYSRIFHPTTGAYPYGCVCRGVWVSVASHKDTVTTLLLMEMPSAPEHHTHPFISHRDPINWKSRVFLSARTTTTTTSVHVHTKHI